MTDKVFEFPNRTPPNRGVLWHSILDAMIAHYPLKKAETLARIVGANPVLVSRCIDCQVADGIVSREGSAA
jgi:hypothetical protein